MKILLCKKKRKKTVIEKPSCAAHESNWVEENRQAQTEQGSQPCELQHSDI